MTQLVEQRTRRPGLPIGGTDLLKMKREGALDVHFIRKEEHSSSVTSFIANPDVHPGLTTQEVWTRLHYNRPYVSRSVTDKAFPGITYYKHQMMVSRMAFASESIMVVHDPGTGKTITLIHAMMELLKARVIKGFYIINNSSPGNRVAIETLINIIYKDYEDYFGIPINQFISHVVKTTTNQRLTQTRFNNHWGLVFDEAHNLLSDGSADKVIKVEDFQELIRKLNLMKGTRSIYSTATPLFGNASATNKYCQLLFRSIYAPQHIPTSMTSYTRINYNHLRVRQILNPAFHGPSNTITGEPIIDPSTGEPIIYDKKDQGDLSFNLTNGHLYEFKVYFNKPSPYQIADFLDMARDNVKNTFQSKGKPMIVASSRKRADGTIEIQSNMLDSIYEKILQRKYGTVIIYSELVGDGSQKVAKYLESRGFERFVGGNNSTRAPQRNQTDTFSTYQKSLMYELSVIEDNIFQLKHKLNNTEAGHLRLIQNQLRSIESYSPEGTTTAAFRKYVEDYKNIHEEDTRIEDQITALQIKLDDLREKYDNTVQQRKAEEKSAIKLKYFIYSSTRTAAEEKAFKEFNSPKNWDGSICPVIIGSRFMRDGIDIMHAVQTHIIIPEWRIPGIVQAQHRGIRSSGHDAIIHHLSDKLVRMTIANGGEISYQEARQIVIKEKITVDIYHHYISVDLLTPDDIKDAMENYPDVFEGYRNDNPVDLLQELHDNATKHGAAAIMYNNAIDTHKSVGAAMMDIWRDALDYKLNVNVDQRLSLEKPDDDVGRANQVQIYTPDKLIGIKDTELFYMDEYTNSIILKIVELLLKHGIINTDIIFRCFLGDEPGSQGLLESECVKFLDDPNGGRISRISIGDDIVVTEAMIATAITEMVHYKKYIYNSRLGINMLVKLYETDEESILYLTTSGSTHQFAHPQTAYVETIGYTVTKDLQRKTTRVTMEDLDLPKTHQTFYKLKDLIKRAMDGTERLSQPDISFLTQMSNYWAFSWKDMTKYKQDPNFHKSDMSVYVFEGHIRNPSINVLAKDLQVHEYRPTTKTWRITTALGLRGAILVRYATLVYCYRAFKFHEHSAFLAHPRFTENPAVFNDRDQNGIILVKGYYDPTPNKDNLVDTLLSKESVLPKPIGSSVLIKKFTSSQSRGSQILGELPSGVNTTHTEAVEYLRKIAERDITLFFFLYEQDSNLRGQNIDIVDIKRHEYEEMLKAIRGNPTPRYHINAVEKANVTPEQRKEIYKEIYKLPNGLVTEYS